MNTSSADLANRTSLSGLMGLALLVALAHPSLPATAATVNRVLVDLIVDGRVQTYAYDVSDREAWAVLQDPIREKAYVDRARMDHGRKVYRPGVFGPDSWRIVRDVKAGDVRVERDGRI